MENSNKNYSFKIVLCLLVLLDLMIWCLIIFSGRNDKLKLYFLNVGQGDSSFVVSPYGKKILIDGGPLNGNLQGNLEKILPFSDRYLDLVIVSHPELDHFAGLLEVLKNYKIGAILTNGQVGKSQEWQEFENIVRKKKLPEIILAAGDKISSRDFLAKILSPSVGDNSSSNDFSLVMLLEGEGIKTLFTGDIGQKMEEFLADFYNVDVDILKVSHHGSKYSSDQDFLKEVSPLISIIEVGKNNYGHPTKEVLDKLTTFGSRIFRTDKDGLIKIEAKDGQLKIFKQFSF